MYYNKGNRYESVKTAFNLQIRVSLFSKFYKTHELC